MKIKGERLRELVFRVIERMGSEKGEAALVAENLVLSNLKGVDSHGVGYLPFYVKARKLGALLPNMQLETIRDTPSIIQFDGKRGYGQRMGKLATEKAIARCREEGVVIMTLRNSHHLGRIGYFGELVAAAGLGSVHFVNVVDHPPLVAAHGGKSSCLGTNPFCISLPSTHPSLPPFLMDYATSAVALGKVREAFYDKRQMEEDCLLDADGISTSNPAVMIKEPKGALRCFGGHKGSALMLACELFAGVLSGGGTMQPENERIGGIVNNMTSFIFDPLQLVDKEYYETETQALETYVKGFPNLQEEKPVIIPNDDLIRVQKEREIEGIRIPRLIWDEILLGAATVGFGKEEIHQIVGDLLFE